MTVSIHWLACLWALVGQLRNSLRTPELQAQMAARFEEGWLGEECEAQPPCLPAEPCASPCLVALS